CLCSAVPGGPLAAAAPAGVLGGHAVPLAVSVAAERLGQGHRLHAPRRPTLPRRPAPAGDCPPRLVGPALRATHGCGGSAFPRHSLACPWRRSPTGDPLRRLVARALATPLPAITRGLPAPPQTAPPTPVAVRPPKPGGFRFRLPLG